MARATAVCTCATCGCEFEMRENCWNRREADRWQEWAKDYYNECPDCREARLAKERAEANAKAAQEAASEGWPELTGTEKQVMWANTLRSNVVKYFDEHYIQNEQLNAEGKVRVGRFISWLLSTYTRAAWWIDNRADYKDLKWLNKQVELWTKSENSATDTDTEAESEKRLQREAEAEMTVAPAEQAHNGAVEITVTDTVVSARYEKNDDFRCVVKKLGYRWDSDRRVWSKAMTSTTGTAQERAAELGNKLLNAGFAVRIADPDTRQAAIDGQYEPEHLRWITCYTSGDYEGWLCVRLPYGDTMYERARKLPKSRYHKPNIAVPASEWAAVEDFADLYDYRITAMAREAIDRAKAAVVTVTPAAAKDAVYAEREPEDMLQEDSGGILDDLRDDD